MLNLSESQYSAYCSIIANMDCAVLGGAQDNIVADIKNAIIAGDFEFFSDAIEWVPKRDLVPVSMVVAARGTVDMLAILVGVCPEVILSEDKISPSETARKCGRDDIVAWIESIRLSRFCGSARVGRSSATAL